MRPLPLALAFLAGAAWGADNDAFAPENPGASGAPVLQIPMGARALGMGTAYTAVASDASALYYNPAGLARLTAHELAASFSLGLADNTLNQLAYGGPLGFRGVTGSGYSSAGASLLYSRGGTIEINRTRPDGSFLGTENRNAGWDLVATAGYAERIGALGFEVGARPVETHHYLGVAAKAVHSTLVQTYSATAWAGDVGYLAAWPEGGWSAGFSALNFGSRLVYAEQGDPLPATLRYGVAYERGRGTLHQTTLSADGDYFVHDRVWHAYAGFEHLWRKTYALRLGYQFNWGKVGLTVGMGVRFPWGLLVDYAWASESEGRFSNVHRFTLGWRFGPVPESERALESRRRTERPPEPEEPLRLLDDAPAPVPRPRPARKAPRKEAPPAGIPGWIY